MTRKLSFESMEARRLLAADWFSQQDDQSIQVAGDVSANAFADVGHLDGTMHVSSALGWFNMYDRIGVSLQRDADISIDLTGIQADVDLYLTNAQGYVVGYSIQRGIANELIHATLDAGQYHVWSIARTYWMTRYQMQVSAELHPEPTPDPVSDPGGNNGHDSVIPLTDVGYFGGSNEWGLNEVGAPESWAAGYRGEGVMVAVVDTGVDLDHPDLFGNLFVNAGEIAGNGIDDDGNGYIDDVHGYDFADNDASADDVHGHGTHVAGTIAALDNGFGATGVAPDATILPIKVLGNNGSGSSIDVAAGIRYAADMGADIINLSLGGGYSSAIESAISYARSIGSLVVAAAGNEYASMPGFPARFSAGHDNVISVGAYDSSGNIAAFSNDVGGSGGVQVDAPGVNVCSTYVGGQYARMSGTSMAAPHVAGIAALTLSADPSLSASALRGLLVAGVIGNANQSDAIGKATTLYSVSYAIAGVSGSSNTSGSSASTSEGGSGYAAAQLGGQRVMIRDAASRSDWTRDDSTDEWGLNSQISDHQSDFGHSPETASHERAVADVVSDLDCESANELEGTLESLSADSRLLMV